MECIHTNETADAQNQQSNLVRQESNTVKQNPVSCVTCGQGQSLIE